MDKAEFVTTDCPDEADGGIEPPDAEIADNPLDIEAEFDPTADPKLVDAPLDADVGFKIPAETEAVVATIELVEAEAVFESLG